MNVNLCYMLTLLMATVVAKKPGCDGIGLTSKCVTECKNSERIRGRNCPVGTVCCRSRRANPYLPLKLGDNLPRQPRKSRPRPSLAKYLEKLKRKYKAKPGLRSSKYCKEWTRLSTESLNAMPLLPEIIPLNIQMDNCAPKFTPLIVGGKNATEGEFPHMVALGYFRNDGIDYLCGGTLISETFVLTAAHCTSTRWGPPVLVHLGAAELYSDSGTERSVVEITVHPHYAPPSCYHDIAILRLDETLKFSPVLRPACLPTPDTKAQFPGSVAIATGWGKLGIGRESSKQLKKVTLKVMNNSKCQEYYAADVKTESLTNGITSDLLCASGYHDAFHDTCQGDSGGPLQAPLPGSDCTFEILGITSFGKACGAAVPGVYTRVAPYVAWIENIVWP